MSHALPPLAPYQPSPPAPDRKGLMPFTALPLSELLILPLIALVMALG